MKNIFSKDIVVPTLHFSPGHETDLSRNLRKGIISIWKGGRNVLLDAMKENFFVLILTPFQLEYFVTLTCARFFFVETIQATRTQSYDFDLQRHG
jgi:hypothetical protein